ncbi:unnamed protein product [Rotaria sp. Silwood2]|nr:unnamed protein product [Rotaria sp. Silwood2]CAF4119522.1 unnamed protein product [Rotaria sp. Silwood2]
MALLVFISLLISRSKTIPFTFTQLLTTISKGSSTSGTSSLNTTQCIADPDWIYNMHQWTYKKGPHSQGSQDLYLEKIFQVISPTNKYFVEFGFNEPNYSTKGSGANTHNLYEKGWRGLLLDGAHENKMINLKKYYLFANNIASIFAENNVPKEPDFISCDMDSHDLWVFRSILQAGYRPRIITTEFNTNYHITDALTLLDPTINCSDSLPKNFRFQFQGCAWGASAGALRIVAEAHGYTMVGRVSVLDLIWMRNDLLKDCFRIPPFEWFFRNVRIGTLHHRLVSSPDVLTQIVDYATYVRTLSIGKSNAAARAILKSRNLSCFQNVKRFL